MVKVNTYSLGTIPDEKILFTVIVAKHNDKWILVKHRERSTWEVPGGHREKGETIDETASRELVEESGAKDFYLLPICVYSVVRGDSESYGQLFYADVDEIGPLPDFEIGEVKLFEVMPESLTYPLIYPILFTKLAEFLNIDKI